MAGLVFLVVASLLWQAQINALPAGPCFPQLPQIPTPCGPTPLQQTISPCATVSSPIQEVITTTVPATSQVVTTVIDNSVANALANAIQLLIVSNLIENTMNSPVANALTASLPPVVEAVPVQATVYNAQLDYISPVVDYINPGSIYPLNGYPISPCEVKVPCDNVIDVIPNVYPDIIGPISPNVGCGCGQNIGPISPNVGCGCEVANIGYQATNIGIPNIGYGCDNVATIGYSSPNIGIPNVGCNCGCDVQTIGYPGNIGLPNVGCGYPGISNVGVEVLSNPYGPNPNYPCDGPIVANYGPINPGYPCDGPIVTAVPEVIYPGPPPQIGCGCGGINGMPNGLPNIAGLLGQMGPNINPMTLLASQLLGNGGLFM